MLQEGRRDLDRKTKAPLQSLGQQSFNVQCRQLFEDKDPAARQQGSINFKGRVLRGRPNQNNGAVFHKGQKSILLGLIETVKFVHEDDRALAKIPVGLCLLHQRLDVFNRGRHRTVSNKFRLGPLGNDLGQGGFADPRRPPKDH